MSASAGATSPRSFTCFVETLAKQHVEEILWLIRGVRKSHWVKRSPGRDQVVEAAWIATRPRQQSSDLNGRGIRHASTNEGTYLSVSEQRNGESTMRGLAGCQREPFSPARCDDANAIDRIDANAAHEEGARMMMLRFPARQAQRDRSRRAPVKHMQRCAFAARSPPIGRARRRNALSKPVTSATGNRMSHRPCPAMRLARCDQRPFWKMPTIGRIPPTTGAEAIEEHHGAIGSQSIGDALHQDSLAHPAWRMDDERRASFAGEDCNIVKNVALNDYLDLGERVRRGIQTILVLYLQLSEYRYPINSFVRLAAGTGFDPDEISQLEQALLRIRIARFAPCGEHC